MRTNLILVEHEEQVKDAWQRQLTGNSVWVAVGPGAMFELEQRKTSFTIAEDYYQPKDLSVIGKESRSRVQEICNTIDELLRQNVSHVKDSGITPTLFYSYAFTLVMDALAARIFQIKRLISEIRPQLVIAYSSIEYPFAEFDICFDSRESLYGRLLSLNGWEVEVNLLPEVKMAQERVKGRRTPVKAFVTGMLSRSNSMYDIAKKLRHFSWADLKQPGGEKAPVVCVYGGYEWDRLLSDLAQSGIKAVFSPRKLNWPKKNIPGRERRAYLVSELEQNSAFRNLFVWEGIDIYPLLKGRIAYLVWDNANQVISTYQEASKLFKRQNISALLTSVKPRAINHAVCLAAQHNNASVFNWQHGSAGYYEHHTIEFFDLLTTDIHIVYGEGVCQSLGEKAEKYQVMLKPVGSILLDRLRSEHKKNLPDHALLQQVTLMKRAGRKICLYVTTNYFQNNWYAGYEPPPSDNLSYQTQLTLMRGLLACPELYLISKLASSLAYRKPPWVGYFQENSSLLIVSSECTFTDLLDYADLIVIDWPSTTLLQAIATDRPVFVVLRHLRLFPEARQMLERRAVCADEPGELVSSLGKYLDAGVYLADVNDNAFLRAYGTHLDDGRSSERAVEEVLKAIKGKGA